jgi:RNA-binding protein YhbY
MASLHVYTSNHASVHVSIPHQRIPQLVVLAARPSLATRQCRHVRLALWRQQATESTAEAHTAAEAQEQAEVEVDSDDPEQQMALLPLPSQYHQPQLTGKQRAALRAQAEQLAKAKTLQREQVGSKGVTLNVLNSIMDMLLKYEFVRVKLGEGSGLERKQTAAQLAQLLDAAVVGQVGFTITLYRQKGLPRPDTLAKLGQE